MLVEGLQIPFGIQPVNPVPVDSWSGPYNSVPEALLTIPMSVRFPTMEVRILGNPVNAKYWFRDDITDSNLIPFNPLADLFDEEKSARISGDTMLFDLITGETNNRTEAEIKIYNNTINITGGTINGDLNITNGTINGDGIGLTGLTIGQPEDTNYSDGIFQDFNSKTRIGIAIDRFNEMIKLLAPPQPSDWNTASLGINSQLYPARNLSYGSVVNITNNNLPTFIVLIPSNGLSDANNGLLSFDIDGSLQDACDVTNVNIKSSGVIRYACGDPYAGQDGKSGFWVGFLSASAISNSLTPSGSLKFANYIHSTKGILSKSFYLDSPLETSIISLTCNVPNMEGYVSGVKTLTAGQAINNISFSIVNVSSYFYSLAPIWKINENLVYEQVGDSDIVPTVHGEIGDVTNKSTNILAGKFNNDNFQFSIQARNSIGVYGNSNTYIDNSKRVDTVSNETERLSSGVGQYPSTFGLPYSSSTSLTTGNTMELQLINGSYKWLSGDYTAFGSPNYSGVTTGDNINGIEYRWATFMVGTKSSAVNSVTITIPSANIGSNWNSIKMFVKIGNSGWLDATTDYSFGDGLPYNNGEPALDIANSTGYNVRKITFGTVPRNGDVYVRIGIKSTDTSFSFKKPIMM